MVLKLLIGLSIIVFIHELGHFLAAKLFKVKVEKFYLFFDFGGLKLFKIKHRNTEFGIGWFPLGGYVKLSGMIDESLDTKHLKEKPKDWEFRAKPAWQRIIIMSGGVFFNLILGIALFWGLTVNQHYLPNKELKNGVYVTNAGENLGLLTGDKLIKINGRKVKVFSEISPLSFYKGKLTVLREEVITEINVPDSISLQYLLENKIITPHNYPALIDSVLAIGQAKNIGLIKGDVISGIGKYNVNSFEELTNAIHNYQGKDTYALINRQDSIFKVNVDFKEQPNLGVLINSPYQYEKYNLINSFSKSIKQSFELLYSNLLGIKLLIKGEMGKENITGPIGIAKIYGNDTSILRFLHITAMISLIIGLMNILPIPGLDGGHIVLTLIEVISGRKLSDKALEIIQISGIVLILLLIVFTFYNDIVNLIK